MHDKLILFLVKHEFRKLFCDLKVLHEPKRSEALKGWSHLARMS